MVGRVSCSSRRSARDEELAFKPIVYVRNSSNYIHWPSPKLFFMLTSVWVGVERRFERRLAGWKTTILIEGAN